MSVRRLIVEVDVDGLNVTEFCREHGVSTWFFYQLRRRYALEGEAGLESRSKAPKRVANRTPGWIENLIVEKRKELDDAGWDAGPATIWTHLKDALPADVVVPSDATIWRILTRRGFITPGTEEGSQTCSPQIRCGAGQRMLAGRRHSLGAQRRDRGESDHHDR